MPRSHEVQSGPEDSADAVCYSTHLKFKQNASAVYTVQYSDIVYVWIIFLIDIQSTPNFLQSFMI